MAADFLDKSDALLVINAGSSSIKFASYVISARGELVADVQGQIENIGNNPTFAVQSARGCVLAESDLSATVPPGFSGCVAVIGSWLKEYSKELTIAGVGHRVVHGGTRFTAPVLVNDEIIRELEQLIPLAALHQPQNLAGIRAFQALMPGVPQVACFDTAFHSTQTDMVRCYGLPARFYEEGVKRYGFHGLSYEYVSQILPQYDASLSDARVIVAHLGNGASLCAMRDGISVATTMGFSVLDGLVMGTRCGSLDPGVILHLMNAYHLDAKALENLLYHESGLLGVSGISSDMKTLLSSRHPDARRAVELFVYRAGRELGSLAAALGGLDVLVFTGGIGEHSAAIRNALCGNAAWLGIGLDARKVAQENITGLISAQDSHVAVWVIPADENKMIAQHTQKVLLNQQ